jgi:hypothetical protein
MKADFSEYLREPMRVEIQIVNFIQEHKKFRAFINLNEVRQKRCDQGSIIP